MPLASPIGHPNLFPRPTTSFCLSSILWGGGVIGWCRLGADNDDDGNDNNHDDLIGDENVDSILRPISPTQQSAISMGGGR